MRRYSASDCSRSRCRASRSLGRLGARPLRPPGRAQPRLVEAGAADQRIGAIERRARRLAVGHDEGRVGFVERGLDRHLRIAAGHAGGESEAARRDGALTLAFVQLAVERADDAEHLDLQVGLAGELGLDARRAGVEQLARRDLAARLVGGDARVAGAKDLEQEVLHRRGAIGLVAGDAAPARRRRPCRRRSPAAPPRSRRPRCDGASARDRPRRPSRRRARAPARGADGARDRRPSPRRFRSAARRPSSAPCRRWHRDRPRARAAGRPASCRACAAASASMAASLGGRSRWRRSAACSSVALPAPVASWYGRAGR